MCPNFKTLKVKDCEEANDIFYVFFNKEYLLEQGLFDEMVNCSIKYFKMAKLKPLLIVDYRNVKNCKHVFGSEGLERLRKLLPYFAGVYFYNAETVIFARENADLRKYIIPDKNAMKKVKQAWKEGTKLPVFEENKS